MVENYDQYPKQAKSQVKDFRELQNSTARSGLHPFVCGSREIYLPLFTPVLNGIICQFMFLWNRWLPVAAEINQCHTMMMLSLSSVVTTGGLHG
jgi:hypothetical protein